MQLAYLLLADHSEALNGKTYAMGAGWNMLRLPQFPHEWGFSIALGVDIPWNATNQRHSLALHVEGPDGEHLGDPFTADFEVGRPPGAIAGQDQRFVISLRTRQTFERTGPHAVVVAIDGEEIERSRFYVVQVPTPTLA